MIHVQIRRKEIVITEETLNLFRQLETELEKINHKTSEMSEQWDTLLQEKATLNRKYLELYEKTEEYQTLQYLIETNYSDEGVIIYLDDYISGPKCFQLKLSKSGKFEYVSRTHDHEGKIYPAEYLYSKFKKFFEEKIEYTKSELDRLNKDLVRYTKVLELDSKNNSGENQ